METKKSGFSDKFLDFIEKNGNKLPDPILLFVILAFMVLICSALFSNVSAVNPATGETIAVTNLLNKDGFIRIMTSFEKNFTGFHPLGPVIIIIIGIGFAEATGFLAAVMKQVILRTPSKLMLPVIFLIGIMGSMTGDAAYIIIPPIAAFTFIGIGKHPVAGLAAGYAAVAGGFTANLIINTTDVVLVGFTQAGADLISTEWQGNAAMNYYFIIASTLVLIPVGVFVSKKFVEPRLGTYTGDVKIEHTVTKEEKKGLKYAGIAAIILFALFLVLVIPENSVFREPDTGSLIVLSPLLFSLVPLLASFFFFTGLVYAISAGVVKNSKECVSYLVKGLKNVEVFILFVFVASQMLAWFGWSNLGPVLAIKGADLLKSIGFEGIPLLVGFVLVASIINLLISSNSAKWAILAPVFVPMLMLLGFNPAATQMAYRIGDSITNPITPMLAYFAMLITFARQYDKNIGMGKILSILIPYSIAFTLFWSLLLVIWVILGIPFGPGFPANWAV